MPRATAGKTTAQASPPADHASDREETLTLNAAAEMLNVDDGYLTKLLAAGEISFTGAGSRRRIRRADLIAYQRARDARRREGLRELTRMGQAAGMDDADYGVLLADPS